MMRQMVIAGLVRMVSFERTDIKSRIVKVHYLGKKNGKGLKVYEAMEFKLNVRCAWCEKMIGTKDTLTPHEISKHTDGICPSCSKKLEEAHHG